MSLYASSTCSYLICIIITCSFIADLEGLFRQWELAKPDLIHEVNKCSTYSVCLAKPDLIHEVNKCSTYSVCLAKPDLIHEVNKCSTYSVCLAKPDLIHEVNKCSTYSVCFNASTRYMYIYVYSLQHINMYRKM